ncbi:MAG TPA: DUF4244 domain-containing protein [Acidimicrobiales bacterium]|jgi:hypothetical protein|nr:DUF4244 domain-containing protein [Acidimicrobiales bacterium]
MFLHAGVHAVRAHQWLRRAATRPLRRRKTATRDDRGQATAEYGLVILAAGGIALGVIAWAAKTGTFTDLFETVVDKLSDGL